MELKIYAAALKLCDLHPTCIQRIFTDIPTDRICGVVCYGTSDTQEYHYLLHEIKSVICNTLGRRVPITLVPQQLLPDGELSLEIYSLEGASEIHVGESNGICYGHIENDEESILFIEGIPASDFSKSVRQQSREVFDKMDGILASYGFTVDDIVRQWNYIGNIVSQRDGKQNYQEFNDARSEYYGKGCWKNGYPAATGIGAAFEGIIVGGVAFKRLNQDSGTGIYPIDNPMQVAAHVYSKKVLVDDDINAVKSTPKFERAKLIETGEGACCFVSGTAAIRGEESVDASSVKLQTAKTIENIEYLVSKENLTRYRCKAYDLKYVKLHVFVKNAEDYEDVKSVVEEAYPQMTVVYTVADVCRGELLVEIEGILIS